MQNIKKQPTTQSSCHARDSDSAEDEVVGIEEHELEYFPIHVKLSPREI